MPNYQGIWFLSEQYQAIGSGNWYVTPTVVLFAGGRTTFNTTGSKVNTIDTITIETAGNATDFGDLSEALDFMAAVGSSTRGVFAGGDTLASGDTPTNKIEYVTFASAGNTTDFGDLTIAGQIGAGCGNETRGIIGVGYTTTYDNTINYITIATAGNAIDFGDRINTAYAYAACSSTTRGVFAGGSTGTNQNVIDYVTIATAGNATDFGDLTQVCTFNAGLSSSTRGVFAGGFGGTNNTINYITIATAGNATDFGDLAVGGYRMFGAGSSKTTGVIGGGTEASATTNVIQSITIATTGNSTDFSDLTQAREGVAGCSNGHGGL